MNPWNETLVRLIAYYIWQRSVQNGKEMTAFDCWIMAVGYYEDMGFFRVSEPG